MTSNISQGYPYSSETEAERAAAVAAILAAREDLAKKVAEESRPLDGNARWWVYVCPAKGCTGRLHVAGYAAEKHAVYTVCDACGKSFLK